jgi:hypothetical protein
VGATWSRPRLGGHQLPILIAATSAALLTAALASPLAHTQPQTHPILVPAPAKAADTTPMPDFTASSGLAGLLSLPIEQQVRFNGVLGNGNPAFHVRAGSSGPRASSPTYGFDASFTVTGATLAAEGQAIGLSLAGIGHGTVSRTFTPTTPTTGGNTVTYRHDGVIETYTNGPLGLAQSFKVADRQEGTGSLTLSMRISGGATARVASDRTSAKFTVDGKPVASYRGLRVTGADGATVPASLAAAGSTLQIRVDDRHARYPLMVDPFVYYDGVKTGTQDGYGYAVAQSTLGWTAIGSPYENLQGGRVYVWWATLPNPVVITGERFGDWYGFSVAAAENSLVVGAPLYDGTMTDTGKVYKYTCIRSTSTYCNQMATMKAWDEQGDDSLGVSVDISFVTNNATIVVAGSPHRGYQDTGAGRVWVNPSGTNVLDEAFLQAYSSSASNQWAGSSIAVSDSNGNTCARRNCRSIVMGAPGTGGNSGMALIYNEPPAGWESVTANVTPVNHIDGSVGDYLGYSVAMSANATILATGAPLHDTNGHADQGSVRVATRNTNWASAPTVVELTDGGGKAGDQLGQAVAIKPNGASIIAAAPYAETPLGGGQFSGEGQVWVYDKPAGGWANSTSGNNRIYSYSGEAAEDHFGEAVDILDNDKIVIGAPDNTEPSGDKGIVEFWHRG